MTLADLRFKHRVVELPQDELRVIRQCACGERLHRCEAIPW